MVFKILNFPATFPCYDLSSFVSATFTASPLGSFGESRRNGSWAY